jgi:hypothetical protein
LELIESFLAKFLNKVKSGAGNLGPIQAQHFVGVKCVKSVKALIINYVYTSLNKLIETDEEAKMIQDQPKREYSPGEIRVVQEGNESLITRCKLD